jgi:hypothetical protein
MMTKRITSALFGLCLGYLGAGAPLMASDAQAVSPVFRANNFIPATDRCYADWSDAAPVVRAEGLIAVKDIHELARRHRIGDLVKVTLCEEKGRFVYRIVVREAGGRIVALSTDARKPFQR